MPFVEGTTGLTGQQTKATTATHIQRSTRTTKSLGGTVDTIGHLEWIIVRIPAVQDQDDQVAHTTSHTVVHKLQLHQLSNLESH